VSFLGPVEGFRTGLKEVVNYFRTHQGDNNCLVDVEL